MVSPLKTMIEYSPPKGDDVLSVRVEQVNDTLLLTITTRTDAYEVCFVRDAIRDSRGSWITERTLDEPTDTLGETEAT
jgi:hypothetical protein